MMMDIFSSFDPQCFTSPLGGLFLWISGLILCFMVIGGNLWLSSYSVKGLFEMLGVMMFNQSNQTNLKFKLFGDILITSLFISLVLFNFMGLVPYVFAPTSHLNFSFGLAFMIWLGMILSSFSYKFYNSLASLLPSGAPWWLNPFLVVIELVSLGVRPLTLAFRLAANMTAGHIVLTLISEFMGGSLLMMSFNSVILGIVNSFYFLFEMGVSLIQAYIFCLLLTLYSNDHQL